MFATFHVSMPHKTYSVVAVATQTIKIQSFDIPTIAEDDGLLKVEMCGVCGSDPRILQWTDPERFPLIMGHEVLGHIEEIGNQASERWGAKKGDRVVVEHLFGCGHCRMCLIGEYRFCSEHLGYGGTIPSTVPPHLWGAYGEFMYLAPNSRVHRIAEDVPAEAAAMTCANIGNGIRWVGTKGGVSVGDTVVIIGPGGQGLAAVLAAHEAGAAQIIAIGLTQDSHRFEVARQFGATHLIDLQVENPSGKSARTHGRYVSRCCDGPYWCHQFRAIVTGACPPHGYCCVGFQHGRGVGFDRNKQNRGEGNTLSGREHPRHSCRAGSYQTRGVSAISY